MPRSPVGRVTDLDQEHIPAAPLVFIHFLLGDDVHAIANLRASLELNPAHLESRVYLAAALQRSGASADAAWEVDEIRALAPDFMLGRWFEAGLMADQRARAGLALAPLGLDGERSAGAGR